MNADSHLIIDSDQPAQHWHPSRIESELFKSIERSIRRGTGTRRNPRRIEESWSEAKQRRLYQETQKDQVLLDQEWEVQQDPVKKKRREEDIDSFNKLLQKKIKSDFILALRNWRERYPNHTQKQRIEIFDRYCRRRRTHLDFSLVDKSYWTNPDLLEIPDSVYQQSKPVHLLNEGVNIIARDYLE